MQEPKNYYGIVAPHAVSPSASHILREAARGEPRARQYVVNIIARARLGDPQARYVADVFVYIQIVTVRNMYTRKYLQMGPKVPHPNMQDGRPALDPNAVGRDPGGSYPIVDSLSWMNQPGPTPGMPPLSALLPPGLANVFTQIPNNIPIPYYANTYPYPTLIPAAPQAAGATTGCAGGRTSAAGCACGKGTSATGCACKGAATGCGCTGGVNIGCSPQSASAGCACAGCNGGTSTGANDYRQTATNVMSGGSSVSGCACGCNNQATGQFGGYGGYPPEGFYYYSNPVNWNQLQRTARY